MTRSGGVPGVPCASSAHAPPQGRAGGTGGGWGGEGEIQCYKSLEMHMHMFYSRKYSYSI